MTTATVTEHLDRAFADHRGSCAIRSDTRQLTYAELDELSAGTAHSLRARGVGKGDRVGVAMDRSAELIATVVAVLRLGATYVPLDPSYPPARVSTMARLAELPLVICDERHDGLFSDTGAIAVPSADLGGSAAGPSMPTFSDALPDDDVYVVFTSGSTGTPKGVAMPHRAIANLIDWQLNRLSFRTGARVLYYSSISFDVSFQEIVTTLASGGELVMIDDDRRRDPRELLRALAEHEIGRLHLPYVALRSLAGVATHEGVYPASLREVITAGEQLRVDDTLRTFFGHLQEATLDNQYGPSETHVVTAHLLDGDPQRWPDLPAIGSPVDRNRVFPADADARPVGPGVTGELLIAGLGLATGYVGRPDLTAERFVQLPDSNERVYRTGDLGFVDEHGVVHYQGRVDDQAKIRGHRVEPAEVDLAIARCAGVAQAFTRVFHNPAGNAYLASYVIASPDAEISTGAIRTELSSRLPDHLVPAFVFAIDRVATGPSGKADLRSLPHPTELVATRTVSYETDVEAKLAGIWSQLLGFDTIERDASFFDLGGDSLTAVTLFLAISEDFGPDLPLATLTRAATLAELARAIEDAADDDGAGYRSLQVLNRGDTDIAPLCLIHGGAGNVLIFRDLPSRMGAHQTVYGFQWPGWDGGLGQKTVAAMADAYVAELKHAHPIGPYRLGGHCLGSLIALEMARRLESLGDVIDGPVVVADGPNVSASSYRPGAPDKTPRDEKDYAAMREQLRARFPAGWEVPDPVSLGDAGGDAPISSRGGSRLHRLPLVGDRYVELRSRPEVADAVGQVKRRLIPALSLTGRSVPIGWRNGYCRASAQHAIRHYRAEPWVGDVLYLRSAVTRGDEFGLSGWWTDLFMGFEELCGGRFEGHVIGGRHNQLFGHPTAADLVRAHFSD